VWFCPSSKPIEKPNADTVYWNSYSHITGSGSQREIGKDWFVKSDYKDTQKITRLDNRVVLVGSKDPAYNAYLKSIMVTVMYASSLDESIALDTTNTFNHSARTNIFMVTGNVVSRLFRTIDVEYVNNRWTSVIKK
jgi:hypothetical protein